MKPWGTYIKVEFPLPPVDPSDGGDCGVGGQAVSTPHTFMVCVEISTRMLFPVMWLPYSLLHQDVLLRLGLGLQDSLKYRTG